MKDLGFSESGSIVGNLLEKFFRATTPNAQASGMENWPQYQAPSTGMKPGESFVDAGNRQMGKLNYTPANFSSKNGANNIVSTSIKKSSGGNSGSKSSGTSLSAQQDALRKKLGKSFGSTIDAYKKMIGWLPDEQSALEAQVNELAGTQKASVTDALNAALEQFKGYRGEVETNQKATLQDLADNTRNLFAAGNNYLGARGAGQSSATGMYSAALTQQANKQRGDVQRQTNEMQNDINMQESQTRAQAQQQIDAIDTWRSTRISEVVQQYQDLKRQLTMAKAQADDSKKAAIAKLDASLFNSAIQNLNSINSMAQSYKQDFLSTMGEQNSQLQGMRQGIANSAQYDVQNQTFAPLEGIESPASMPDGTIVGYYQGRRVQVDQNGNILAYLD